MGFPFESITDENGRNDIMTQLLLYLRTTKLPFQPKPELSTKLDIDYRFPTGTPVSKHNVEIEN